MVGNQINSLVIESFIKLKWIEIESIDHEREKDIQIGHQKII